MSKQHELIPDFPTHPAELLRRAFEKGICKFDGSAVRWRGVWLGRSVRDAEDNLKVNFNGLRNALNTELGDWDVE